LNRFSGFEQRVKTAEAVLDLPRLLITPLKWGVNEILPVAWPIGAMLITPLKWGVNETPRIVGERTPQLHTPPKWGADETRRRHDALAVQLLATAHPTVAPHRPAEEVSHLPPPSGLRRPKRFSSKNTFMPMKTP
jgi:hypothetical protein